MKCKQHDVHEKSTIYIVKEEQDEYKHTIIHMLDADDEKVIKAVKVIMLLNLLL